MFTREQRWVKLFFVQLNDYLIGKKHDPPTVIHNIFWSSSRNPLPVTLLVFSARNKNVFLPAENSTPSNTGTPFSRAAKSAFVHLSIHTKNGFHIMDKHKHCKPFLLLYENIVNHCQWVSTCFIKISQRACSPGHRPWSLYHAMLWIPHGDIDFLIFLCTHSEVETCVMQRL